MKLDRNITQPDGSKRGKYALIKLRVDKPKPIHDGTAVTVLAKAVDYGDSEDTDFFAIRLKDKYAIPALMAYADAAALDDLEYSCEIRKLVMLAMTNHNRQIPT